MLVFQGTLVHFTNETSLEVLTDKVIGVQNSKIVFVEDEAQLRTLRKTFNFSTEDVKTLGPREFLLPGLIDAHVHPHQIVGAGIHPNHSLGKWICEFARPLTDRVSQDPEFAEETNRRSVRRLLKNGTTTAAYFCVNHVPTVIQLCDIMETMGQRGVVGVTVGQQGEKVLAEEAVAQIQQVTEDIRNRKTGLIRPALLLASVFSPSTDLLKAAGQLSSEQLIPCHTHLAESADTEKLVKERKPEFGSSTDALNKCGLLRDGAILAHGVHLTDEDVRAIASNGAGIVHCPNSNISLASGLCDVRRLQACGVKVALGTDLCGGYNASMLDAIRSAVQTSYVLKILKAEKGDFSYTPIDFKEALGLATIGSSKVLGLADKVGNFVVGKEFDALRVNLEVANSPVEVFPADTVEDLLQKFVFLGDDRNITEVYVAGKSVTVT